MTLNLCLLMRMSCLHPPLLISIKMVIWRFFILNILFDFPIPTALCVLLCNKIIFSVSYYFDKLDYANKNVDFDPEMYVAGGVVCWDMQAEDWTWLIHLDLTTSKSKYEQLTVINSCS